ncbi:hypothetical protein Esti_002400 [Eimeria stiedai]
MSEEGEEPGQSKYEIITRDGRSHSSRGYTGPAITTYLIDEEGGTEHFRGEYASGIRQGRGKKYWITLKQHRMFEERSPYNSSTIREYEFVDGSKFLGNYENNKKNGVGDVTYIIKQRAGKDGDSQPVGSARYLGHFVGGQRQSYGCMKYPNGDTYKGEWLAGKKHGKGSYHFFSDGSELSGFWVEGSLKRGRWILPTGATYVGEFALNKPTGQGSWLLPQGRQVLVECTQEVSTMSKTLPFENPFCLDLALPLQAHRLAEECVLILHRTEASSGAGR